MSRFNGRKISWILGAGASLAAGATAQIRNSRKPIPTQASFWEVVMYYTLQKDKPAIQSFLLRYFKNYTQPPRNIKTKTVLSLIRDINVEEVFTFLSERISSPATSGSLKSYLQEIWPALIRSVARTFKKFPANTKTRATYHKFENQYLRSHDAVISFNYDTVFEDSIKREWHYSAIHTPAGLPIIKPHGSINWERKDNSIILSTDSQSPIIVAPSHLKFTAFAGPENPAGYLNQHRLLDKIWSSMEKQIIQSKALVFIGYSFPEADLYFSSVLRTALSISSSKQIVIVNPDAVRIAERLQSRFSIDQRSVQKYFDLNTFLQAKRTDILKQ